ncbi:MAG: exodeoxyribonuclease VII large subunit [Candidatus Cloacimonetes bacterium]|nr:exodeoxyribonuclease VII large subunit [Candidatus Cloacimonadota bacterium]
MDDIIVFSVYEVTLHLKRVVETQIEAMYVTGEISNYIHHTSGHIYFNLKDDRAVMRCTFFRGANMGLEFRPEDGMQVICFGKLTVYEKGGQYNLNVQTMLPAGKGLLQVQFEQLKKKLHDEGLFEPSHKQQLPRYPRRIGVITSPTGAALQDIRNILMRRFPVEVVVYPALVQGNEAPPQLIAGIRYFNRVFPVDVIILTRGGGSQEDLFCFNDEGLARAVFASRVPVISAVGHEIDFSIADFVADLRAPTPSAAAELVVPDKNDLLPLIASMAQRTQLLTANRIARIRNELQSATHTLAQYHPQMVLQSFQQRLDQAELTLGQTPMHFRQIKTDYIGREEKALALIRNRFHTFLFQQKMRLQYHTVRLPHGIKAILISRNNRLEQACSSLRQQSPTLVLQRGYAIISKDAKAISSVQALHPDDLVSIRMSDGKADARVQEIEVMPPSDTEPVHE